MSEETKHQWDESSMYVIKSIEALDQKVTYICSKIDRICEKSEENNLNAINAIAGVKLGIAAVDTKVEKLKERINIRSSLFGSLGSAITLIAAFLLQLLLKK